jgi:hypothetical protein
LTDLSANGDKGNMQAPSFSMAYNYGVSDDARDILAQNDIEFGAL